MGSYTVPTQLLFTAPEDTRSSESIGVEPLRAKASNAGLLLFWATVVVLELSFVLALAAAGHAP